jgi:hypothetical protein
MYALKTARQLVSFRDVSAIVDSAWQPARTGDYTADCQIGRDIADEIADVIAVTHNPTILPTIVSLIVEAGQWGAVEIGLFNKLGCALRY